MEFFKNDDAGKFILRMTLGILMIFHGTGKVLNPGALDFIGGRLGEVGLPSFVSWGVYLGEFVAPILLILGVYARIGGVLVSVNMVFAIGLVHTHEFFSINNFGGWTLELQGFFLLCGLAVLFLGSGRWAIRPD